MIELLDFQGDHAAKILDALKVFNVSLDASDTGTGKTYTALWAAEQLGKPVLVICPLISVPMWRGLLEASDVKEWDVVNYEKVRNGNHGYFRKLGAKKKNYYRIQPEAKGHLFIFDEAQYAKTATSLNGKLVRACGKECVTTLLLSATLADDPRDMRNTGELLGLFEPQHFVSWMFRHGVTEHPVLDRVYDFDKFRNRHHLQSIHDRLFKRKASRMRISELGDKFPETLISAETYDFEGAAVAYERIRERVEEMSEKALLASNDLTFLVHERQAVEMSKVPGMAEMAEEALRNGQSVAAFFNYTAPREAFMERMGTDASIHGDQSMAERTGLMNAFQNNDLRILVLNSAAGGMSISLHDLTGEHPRLALISPSFDGRNLKQVLGRVHRAGGVGRSVQRLLYAAGTVEEQVCRSVRQKIYNIDTINDREANPLFHLRREP